MHLQSYRSMDRCWLGASDEIHDNLYGRHVCDSISYHFAGICMYHDLKLYPWYHGEGFTADEYVCGRYADEIMVGFVVLFLTVSLLPSVANFIFTEMKKLMVLFIEGMYWLGTAETVTFDHGMGSSVVCKGRTRWWKKQNRRQQRNWGRQERMAKS